MMTMRIGGRLKVLTFKKLLLILKPAPLRGSVNSGNPVVSILRAEKWRQKKVLFPVSIVPFWGKQTWWIKPQLFFAELLCHRGLVETSQQQECPSRTVSGSNLPLAGVKGALRFEPLTVRERHFCCWNATTRPRWRGGFAKKINETICQFLLSSVTSSVCMFWEPTQNSL